MPDMARDDAMKLRKGMVPLILFLLVFAAWAVYTVVAHDPAPMENGASIFGRH